MTKEETENKFAIKGKVKNVTGSVLFPESGNLKFVLNILDMSEKTKSVMADLFSKKWNKVNTEARGWYARRENFKLGAINNTAVQSDVWVLSVLCKDKDGVFDKKSLDTGLKTIADMALYEKAAVHVAQKLVEDVPELTASLDEQLIKRGVNIYYYSE